MKRPCPPVCCRRKKEAWRRLRAPTRARRQRHRARPRRQSDATRHETDRSTTTAALRARAPTEARRQRHHALPRRQNGAKRQGADTSTTTAAPRAPPPPKRRGATRDRQEHHHSGPTRQGTDRSTTTAAPRALPPPKRRDVPGRRHEHDDSGTTRAPATKTTRRDTRPTGARRQRHHAHPRRKKDTTRHGPGKRSNTAPPRAPAPEDRCSDSQHCKACGEYGGRGASDSASTDGAVVADAEGKPKSHAVPIHEFVRMISRLVSLFLAWVVGERRSALRPENSDYGS